MNKLVLELRFLEVVFHLVNREGMRVIYANPNGEEVWIEDDRQEPYQIIRIAFKDFDWSNELKRDIDRAAKEANKVRKELNLRSANVINVMLTLFEPVDSYEEWVDKPLPLTGGGKYQQRNILIPLEKLEETFFPLATEWKLREMPQFLVYNQLSDPEAVNRSLRISIQRASEKRLEEERSLFLHGKPILTSLLLGAVLAIFALMEFYGSSTDILSLIQFGAKFNPLILEGEWWRFFTAMFLHIGIIHLLMNSLALFYLGSAVERIYGTVRFFVIYLIAGLAGSIASFSFNEQISAGASGAIFGCFGALLYFGVIHRRLFFRTMGMNVIVILLINLAFGFMVPMVDNGAHIGGLIGGFVASAIVSLPKTKRFKSQILALFLGAIGLVGLLQYGYSKEPSTQSYLVYLQISQEYLQKEEVSLARPYLERILEGNLEETESILTETYFFLAYTQVKMQDYEEAEANLLKTIERKPDFHEAHFNLSLVYLEQGRYENAYDHLQEAIALNPDDEDYKQLKQQLLRWQRP